MSFRNNLLPICLELANHIFYTENRLEISICADKLEKNRQEIDLLEKEAGKSLDCDDYPIEI